MTNKVNIIGSEAKEFFKNLYGNTTYLQKENDRINLIKKAEEKGIDKTKIASDVVINGSLGFILQGSNLSIYPGGEQVPVSTAAEVAN